MTELARVIETRGGSASIRRGTSPVEDEIAIPDGIMLVPGMTIEVDEHDGIVRIVADPPPDRTITLPAKPPHGTDDIA